MYNDFDIQSLIYFLHTRCPTYDSFIFYNAIGEHPDYFYRPIAVAKQVVNGTNYRFMTIAEPEQSDLTPHFAIVEIYQPLEGRAYATKITPV